MATMTISDKEWTLDGLTAGWAEEETEQVATAAANSQYAWLVLNTRAELADAGMRGWQYDGICGAFSGPAAISCDALGAILSLITASVDYVVEHLEEIRKENAEQAA